MSFLEGCRINKERIVEDIDFITGAWISSSKCSLVLWTCWAGQVEWASEVGL
jgi:hypothetical protein